MLLNISIFAHIQLDAELQGRYGVQGNAFENTFGYLEQYLGLLKKKQDNSFIKQVISEKNSKQLDKITQTLQHLVKEEKICEISIMDSLQNTP